MHFFLYLIIAKIEKKQRTMEEYLKKVKRIQSLLLKGKKFSFIDKGINFIY